MSDKTAPAATAPAASQPKVKTEIEQRYDEAGYARNRAELAYNNAVKEHGKDSAEAKAAKTVLDEKQVAVEAIQKEINGGAKKAPKPVAQTPSKTPAPTQAKIEKIFVELPKAQFRAMEYIRIQPKAAYLYEVRSEVIFKRDISKFLDSKNLKEFKQCVEKAEKEKKDALPCAEKLIGKPAIIPSPLHKAALSKVDQK